MNTTTNGGNITQDLINQNKEKNLNFDILDLSTIIDINAETRAIDEFEKEMRNTREGNMFKRFGGFFKRSFQRMGRDAWIETKKREYINKIKEGLKTGEHDEESLRSHINSADEGIENEAFLSHEKNDIESNKDVTKEIQELINKWIDLGEDKETEKKEIIKELKTAIEEEYPTITTDISQLENSLIRLEKAKIGTDLKTIDAKLNILDIGRIERGHGLRKETNIVKFLDKINQSKLPKWVKSLAQHPNTAAVLSALGTRTTIGLIVGGTTLGFAGGFLAPIAVGALTGGYLVAGRARREMRDRNAQIDRKGAKGINQEVNPKDGIKTGPEHQNSAMDLYNDVAKYKNEKDENDENKEENRNKALSSSIYYLVKHLVGRTYNLNMLQYDNDKSISKQHIEMIKLINEVFPELVSKFNSWELFEENNDSEYSIITRRLYKKIDELAKKTIEIREQEEKKYAIKQGAIYTGVATLIGSSVGAILHGLDVGSTPGHDTFQNIPGTKISHYPDNLSAYSIKHRNWFDNGTPAPKFDYTELMVHTNKSGGWNVTNMLGESPFNHGNTLSHISSNDFTNGNIQAVITPKTGGSSFVLPIDAKGNIQIPQSMQSAFNNREFAFLEIGRVKINGTNINLESIATVKGHGTMIFNKIEEIIGGGTKKIFVPGENNWYGVPFGANEYHELGEDKNKNPVGKFIKPKEGESLNVDDKPKEWDDYETVEYPEELSNEIHGGINDKLPPSGLSNPPRNNSVALDLPNEEEYGKDEIPAGSFMTEGEKNENFNLLDEDRKLKEEINELENEINELERIVEEKTELIRSNSPDNKVKEIIELETKIKSLKEELENKKNKFKYSLDNFDNILITEIKNLKIGESINIGDYTIERKKVIYEIKGPNEYTGSISIENKTNFLINYFHSILFSNGKVSKKEKLDFLKNISEGKKEIKKTNYENNIEKLIGSGLLATQYDVPLIYNTKGRTMVAIRTKNGGIIPFYRSCNGTDGKTQGTWYPFFGLTNYEDKNFWVIKASDDKCTFGNKELEEIQEKLNSSLNRPTKWDTDFNNHQDKNPLVKMNAINSYSWIIDEEEKQKKVKPKNINDISNSISWIKEWINRVSPKKD